MISAAIFILLQALDWWTTRRVLLLGGVEKNPVMRWVINHGGIWSLLAVKMAVGIGISWACVSYGIAWVLAPLCLAYSWVVWCNWKTGNEMGKKKSGGSGRPKPQPKPNNKPKPKGI